VNQAPPPGGTTQLVERALLLILVGGLVVGVLLVLRPFATAIMFGSILAIASWPLRAGLVARGMRPSLAAAVLLLLMLALLVVPLLLVAPGLVASIEGGVLEARGLLERAPREPPSWVLALPLVGAQAAALWERVTAAHGDVMPLIQPYTAQLRGLALSVATGLLESTVQILLSLAAAAMLWSSGDAIGAALDHAASRLGGETARRSLDAAAGAVRSVAYGVVGTSVLQAVLQGIGLAIAGVPNAILLGFLTLIFSISQILGPLVIVTWIGAAWWLFDQGSTGWAVFMLAWGLLLVSSSDNVVRPLLIKRGVRMPLSLIILGVFGGFVAFGFLGLFIGPTLLAVAYVLLEAWRAGSDQRASGPPESQARPSA
jgi:predicted PurR-regulated permease PerM